jgi:acyl-CoA dehydrogenase
VIVAEELHWIGLPPVIQFGSAELLESVARPVLAGQRRIAFAVTEPSGGSDAAALQTRAERRAGSRCC